MVKSVRTLFTTHDPLHLCHSRPARCEAPCLTLASRKPLPGRPRHPRPAGVRNRPKRGQVRTPAKGARVDCGTREHRQAIARFRRNLPAGRPETALDGLSLSDVASVLGITAATARARLHRARRRIRYPPARRGHRGKAGGVIGPPLPQAP
ncbi:sigma factor-like helix-turn-helix DNA-binding protein [Amycolatopsis decaplanina]|uniref:sigma factor-like helix-turn-helix DNA-binding protein n=1 Tax=Amycolatopsis decaplanina TaxID=208441 RepID=UPI001267AAF1